MGFAALNPSYACRVVQSEFSGAVERKRNPSISNAFPIDLILL
jgi:hypothetical protein